MRDSENLPTAVITGAGSGLGRELANQCHASGMRVVLLDIDRVNAEGTAASMHESRVDVHQCDVSDARAVEEIAGRVMNDYGRIDLLVNNAGVLRTSEVPEADLGIWNSTIEVNLLGVVHGITAFVPLMRPQPHHSQIVNVASFGGLVAGLVRGIAPYVATKFAVVGLSRQLRADLAPDDIGVTVACPTFMDTPMNVGRKRDDGLTPPATEQVAKEILAAAAENRPFAMTKTDLQHELRRQFAEIDDALSKA